MRGFGLALGLLSTVGALAALGLWLAFRMPPEPKGQVTSKGRR